MIFRTIFAGESGKYPTMKQGALTRNDLKNIKDGCCYGYSGEAGDGSLISGPVISCSATGQSAIQIKGSNDGMSLYFRVKDITNGSWSIWKKII